MTALDALLNRLDALRDRYETDARKAIESYAQSTTITKAAILHPSKDTPATRPKQPHWTKRPENAAKARAWKRAMKKATRRATS
jgi:hypothetical protein